jgi:hypothetical protein
MPSSAATNAHFARAALRRWARSVQTAAASSSHDHAAATPRARADLLTASLAWRVDVAFPTNRDKRAGRACDARSSFSRAFYSSLDARASITRAPLTSTLPSKTFDRLRVLTDTLPRLILWSPTTLCRLAVTVSSLTLAQPIPSKSNRPNGLLRSGSTHTATGLKQHRRLNSPFSRLHCPGASPPTISCRPFAARSGSRSDDPSLVADRGYEHDKVRAAAAQRGWGLRPARNN